MDQRKQAVMDYLFKGGGFALGDVTIVNVIAKKLQIVPGSFNIDSILIENNFSTQDCVVEPRCEFYFEYAQVCLLYEKQ
jgi:hypothetical protein